MIPEHLKGKSAAQIVNETKRKMFDRSLVDSESEEDERRIQELFDSNYRDYVLKLEMLLLIAVRDALCNADGKMLCDGNYALMGSEAEGRAIAFLNTVLSKE